MTRSLSKSKKRILITFLFLYVVTIGLCLRIGWIQIVKGEEYARMATEQQTRDVPIEARRGAIFDRNGSKIGISEACYFVWARPANLSSQDDPKKRKADIDRTAKELAKILKKDKKDIKKLLTKKRVLIKIDRYLDKKTADKIREKKLRGIEIAEGSKRVYPRGAFAAHTLGSVTEDNDGLSGLELAYNQDLSGVSGRWIKNADAVGNGLSVGDETYYKPKEGSGLVLTIDEGIQHFVEKTIEDVQKNTHSDRVLCIMMDPKTGDILALAQTPGFDPNKPKTPLKAKERAKLNKLSDKNKLNYWNDMWRNSLFSDVYEPGSTFKLITTAAALEEETKLSEKFNCGGSINVAGQNLKCWRYYSPHGTQTLKEAVGNSCNPVFVRLAQRLGSEKFYSYLETFGLTEKTGVDFPGEASSLLLENPGPVELATMGYGQGVAITPIELITAVSSLGNKGKLMQPRLVKALVDENEKTVREFSPVVVRQTVSQKTTKEMCQIMEYVVDKGGAGTAKVPGYRVGGKTGTANKLKGKGKKGYSDQTYSSFIGMAPMNDPKVAILIIVDNPKGVKFGSQTAAPGAKIILENTLQYLELKPSLTKEEQIQLNEKKVIVPDVTGEGLEDAIGILGGCSLKYKTDGAQGKNFIVKDQYPKPGEKVNRGDVIYLYRK